jgi:hypothetical protein
LFFPTRFLTRLTNHLFISSINVAAVNLSTVAPTTGVLSLFSSSSSAALSRHHHNGPGTTPQTERPQLDLSVLAELPDDIRREVAREYGIDDFLEPSSSSSSRRRSLETSQGKHEEQNKKKKKKPRLLVDYFSGNSAKESAERVDGNRHSSSSHVRLEAEDEAGWQAEEVDGDIPSVSSSGKVQCPEQGCGLWIFSFALEAHLRSHREDS